MPGNKVDTNADVVGIGKEDTHLKEVIGRI